MKTVHMKWFAMAVLAAACAVLVTVGECSKKYDPGAERFRNQDRPDHAVQRARLVLRYYQQGRGRLFPHDQRAGL